MIQDVKIIPLRKIPDERGTILHLLRCDAPHFEKFGEAYFSKVYPGVIKGWHVHKTMVQFYAVPIGMIKLVLYDLRPDSPTKGELMELFIGEDNYCLVRIPSGIANGYKCFGPTPALVANCATEPYLSGDEMERIDPMGDRIPYKWNLVHR